MDYVCELMYHGNPLQKMIFLGAMYLTHPEEAPEEQVKDILNRISELKTRLTDNELEKSVRAMGILITVEGFPAVNHEELEDFLSAYESDAIPDAFVFD